MAKLSHEVIKSLYNVLAWYNRNRGAPSSPRILRLFTLWKSLHAVFINISEEGWRALRNMAKNLNIYARNEEEWLFLYALETYLNIVMRAIALSKIGASISDHGVFMNEIMSRRGIFEPNVFEWIFEAFTDKYLDQNVRIRLQSNIDLLLMVLYNIDMFQVSFDMFREVYQNILPREVRKSLGEFYTNEEIVKRVLDAAGFDANAVNSLYDMWRRGERDTLILDPACGSGSFLVSIIRRIFISFDKPPRDIVRFIEENVVGIDINPFAVEMAKLNMIMAIADEMQRLGGAYIPTRLRIYWADSLARVKRQNKLDYQAITIYMPSLTEIIGKESLTIPYIAGKDPMDIFDKVNRYAENRMDIEDLITREHLENIAQSVRELYKDLRDIHENGNSRIVEMIRNIIAVQSLVNRCSYVVGNPPWVRIHNISRSIVNYLRNNYEWLKSGSSYTPRFKKTKTPFLEQFDYSVAFFERGLEFLRDGGVLSYVITSKVIRASYAGKMREDLVKNHEILEIIDYSLYPVPLFQDAVNYPLIISLRKAPPTDENNTRSIVKVTVFNTVGNSMSFDVEQNMLPLYSETNYPDKMRSPWVLAPPKAINALKKIINNSYRLGDLYEVMMGVKTSLNSSYIGTISGCTSSNIVRLNLEGGSVAEVEEFLVYPIVRGEDIDPYGFDSKDYIIFTHDTESFKPLWDRDQREVLKTLGLLKRGVRIEASGGVLKYIVDAGANCIAYVQDSIKILQNKGYQVNFAKPCSVYMCLDVRNLSGDPVLMINIEVQSNKTCRLIYNVTGLRIPGAPRATDHFTKLFEELVNRDDYKDRGAVLPPWAIFRVSKEKFKEHRIAWQEMTMYIEAAYLPLYLNVAICSNNKENKKLLIPLQTTYFIVESNHSKALKLLIYMNSDLARSMIKMWAWTARGGYYRHTSYSMGILPLPRDLVDNKLWGFLEDLLKQQKENIDLNEIAKNKLEADMKKKMEKELMQSLGLDEEEYRELVEYGKWLNELGKAPETEEDTVEEEYAEE
jgi:type I restriction-modification system DNA methylase subunit